MLSFLGGYTQLYKSLHRPSVRQLVRPLVTLLKFLPIGFLNRIKALAHLYMTDAVVFMALLQKSCKNYKGDRPTNRWTACMQIKTHEEVADAGLSLRHGSFNPPHFFL